MSDNKNENKDKVTVIGDQAKLTAKLDGIKWSFKCNLTGAKKPVALALRHGDEIKDIPIRLECNGATVYEAMKFACGGQSYRVAIQRRLRIMKADDLRKAADNNAPLIFHLSDLVNPVRAARVPVEPKVAAERAVDQMSLEERIAFMKEEQRKLDALIAAKNAENAE